MSCLDDPATNEIIEAPDEAKNSSLEDLESDDAPLIECDGSALVTHSGVEEGPREEFSKVSNIRVVPFQHEPSKIRPRTSRLSLEYFHAGKTSEVGGEGIKYEELKSEGNPVETYKDRIIGYSQRAIMETIDASYESFSYVMRSSFLRRAYKSQRSLDRRMSANVSNEFKRMYIVVLISFMTSTVATMIDQSIAVLARFKYTTLRNLYNQAFLNNKFFYPYLFGTFWNTFFAFLAGLCVYISPVAQGSGIPQIKCYLNGVKIPRVVRIKTLLCKSIGVVMSVVGGFPVGKEGPMIHSGAAIGAGVSQGKSTSLRFTSSLFKEFRNDKDKRDFVACGAAAGVAAAFGAPMGGVLFAFEGGASYFSPSFIWRLAVCSYLSSVFLQLYRSFFLGIPGQVTNGGLISFGHFEDATYSFYSLVSFVVIGVLAAASGSLFNILNLKITQFRIRHMNNKWCKLIEVVLTGMFIGASAFMMILVGNQCERDVDFSQSSGMSDEIVYRLNCSYNHQSSTANLWYKTPEDTLKSLFHDDINTHNWQTLLPFAVFYWFLSCFTYGLAISNGLFIPCLLIGATWGRCLGIFFITNMPSYNWGFVGDFALIGACAQLAATVRLNYSLTVIVLECIGNNTYILPIFLATLIAKHLGDAYTKGIYDLHIQLSGIPILEDEPQMRNAPIIAQMIMSKNVRYLPIKAKISDVINFLKTTSHSVFPIVDTPAKLDQPIPTYGRLRGAVTRHDIITMINAEVICNGEDFGMGPHTETWATLRDAYPRYPTMESIKMSESDQERFMIDFSLCMDLSPITCNRNMLYTPLFEVYRNCGCSHMFVLNHDNEVLGVITRKDLVTIEPEHPSFNVLPKLRRKPVVVPVTVQNSGIKDPFQEMWSSIFSRKRSHKVLVEEPCDGESAQNSVIRRRRVSKDGGEQQPSTSRGDDADTVSFSEERRPSNDTKEDEVTTSLL